MTNISTALLRLGSALLLATVGLTGTTAPSRAEGVPHQVKYTVFSGRPFYVEIYYRDTDPPNFAGYSHNPYLYRPTAEADVGPDKQWVRRDAGTPRAVGHGHRYQRAITGNAEHSLRARGRRASRRHRSRPQGRALLAAALVSDHRRHPPKFGRRLLRLVCRQRLRVRLVSTALDLARRSPLPGTTRSPVSIVEPHG